MRWLFQRHTEWGLSLFVFDADILAALDNMQHSPVEKGLRHRKVPAELILAAMRELFFQSIHPTLAGVRSISPAFLAKGGMQGHRSTPEQWNTCLAPVVDELVHMWRQEGCLLQLDDQEFDFTILLWADNI